jgi:hypothetical protein
MERNVERKNAAEKLDEKKRTVEGSDQKESHK